MQRRSHPAARLDHRATPLLGGRIPLASLLQTLAVAEHLNFRPAANALGVSQSSVSARRSLPQHERTLSKVLARKRAARSRLQVFLKLNPTPFVGEREIHDELPRAVLRRVHRAPRIVIAHSRPKVRRQTDEPLILKRNASKKHGHTSSTVRLRQGFGGQRSPNSALEYDCAIAGLPAVALWRRLAPQRRRNR